MVATNYPKCLAAVLLYEGGFTNNPHDPGGATNKGVAQRVYDAYREDAKLAVQSVRLITNDEVNAIYYRQYWTAIHGDDLPSGIDECVFDEAVNSGVGRAIKDMQTVLGVVSDGQIGMVTLGKIRAINDRVSFINRYCDNRLSFLHRLSTFQFFRKGWTNRIAAVRKLSLGLASN